MKSALFHLTLVITMMSVLGVSGADAMLRGKRELLSTSERKSAKAATWVAIDAIVNGLGWQKQTVGPADDEIRYTNHKGQKILYFEGTDTSLTEGTMNEWLSNFNCVAAGCDVDSVVDQTYAFLPSSWKDSNDVICVGFSRGNFFAGGFANKKGSTCKYMIGIASPGQARDPRSGARTIVIGSASDPISYLRLPLEENHYSRAMGWASHSTPSYRSAIRKWVNENGDATTSQSDSSLANRISAWAK